MDTFFLFDSLRPGQQFFSYVGTGLPGLNQYKVGVNVSCSGHNSVRPLRLKPATLDLESSTLTLSHCTPSSGYIKVNLSFSLTYQLRSKVIGPFVLEKFYPNVGSHFGHVFWTVLTYMYNDVSPKEASYEF